MTESLPLPELQQKRVEVQVSEKTIERIDFMRGFHGSTLTELMRTAMAITKKIIESDDNPAIANIPGHKQLMLTWLRGLYDSDIHNNSNSLAKDVTLMFNANDEYHAFVAETTVDGPFTPEEFIETSILLLSQARTQFPG